MNVKLYHYPACSTCKQAITYLTKNGLEFEAINIVDHPPSLNELEQMSQYLENSGGSFKSLFNTSGVLYRELKVADQLKAGLSKEKSLALLSKNGKLIKRPFLLGPDFGTVGFKVEGWKKIFSPIFFFLVFFLGASLAGSRSHADVSASAPAACFEPAIAEGLAAKDSLTSSLVVVQLEPSKSAGIIGDTIVGLAVKGTYFGCRVSQKAIQPKTVGVKKFSLYLPLKKAPVQGFEVDLSTESRRVLATRAIQVPWDVVDRSQGVTATCFKSTPTSFEGFLYGALKKAKSRRCTEVEIQAFVGYAK